MNNIYNYYAIALKKECRSCICAHCLIAETNGGAPGCGNCKECKGERPIHDCGDFYAVLRLFKASNMKEDNNDSEKES